MTNDALNKELETKNAIRRLQKQNRDLRVQVGSNTGLIAFALRRLGMSEKDITKLSLKLVEQNAKRVEAEDAKDKLQEELGDVDGIESGKKR